MKTKTIAVSEKAYELITDKQLEIVGKLSETHKYRARLFRLCSIGTTLDILLNLKDEKYVIEKLEERI